MAKQRIGVFGGTFDPVHTGHLQMALSMLASDKLDRLLVMPSGSPPYKSCLASAEDRWKMVVTACAGEERLVPSRLELDRQGDVYTVDTLLQLKEEYPRADLVYLIGADALLKLRSWRRFEEILPLCAFWVFPRVSGVDPLAFQEEKKRLSEMGAKIRVLQAELMPVSSTEIREVLASGRSAPNLPPAVGELIEAKGLYGFPVRIPESAAWVDQLFGSLNAHRFAHSLSVAETARRLALIHGIDPLAAEAAGLLHDCAKNIPMKEMRRLAEEHALTDDPHFLETGALLHSLAGAWVAEHEYGMKDPAILDAIRYHNTGCPGMSRLARCVCLADYIEPLRDPYPTLEKSRSLSETSLEKALLYSLQGTADYVLSRGKFLHPRTKDTIAWLKTLTEE